MDLVLFDTSSFYLSLQKNHIHLLKNAFGQPLIKYELGNIIWKEIHLIKTISKSAGLITLSFAYKIFKKMTILDPDHESTLELATDLNLTYYDASYVQIALKINVPLITEDKKIKKAANKIITTLSLKDIL